MDKFSVFLLSSFLATAPTVGVGPIQAAPKTTRNVLIKGVPHIRQKPDFCGEACAAMYLNKLGLAVDQDFIFDHAGLDPVLGRGCYTKELATALRRIGFRIGPVWYPVDTSNAESELANHFDDLVSDLSKGIPSIVCTRYDNSPDTTEHFRLILGYDPDKDHVYYHEPAVSGGAYRQMSRAELLSLWPLKYRADSWTLIRMPLSKSRLIAGKSATKPTDADYAQHVMRLRKKLPHSGFHIVLQKPFIVIGDEAREVVDSRSLRTVKWAVDRLKRVYFDQDPSEILEIWLFQNKQSYEKHTWELFRDTPTTPFGYYSPSEKALIMNIATGGGTLVHEIVHPFMAANFARCPSWFNEGLASLYEQCRDRDGRIWGSTNWRLAGLQKLIRSGNIRSFKSLCGTGRREFYHGEGDNYAQARYLCYYLQEQGLLVKFFHEFKRSAATDPTGYHTLCKILGEEDMEAFEQRWQKFVLALRY